MAPNVINDEGYRDGREDRPRASRNIHYCQGYTRGQNERQRQTLLSGFDQNRVGASPAL